MGNPDIYPHKGSMIKGRYEVLNIKSAGGTAIILPCIDRVSGKKVAIKRFFPDRMTKPLKEKIREEPLLDVRSDYIVKGEECFSDDGIMHLVMPFLDGECLRDILDIRQRLDLTNAIYIVLCIAKACADLHAALIISTDIKPGNIIVTIENIAKLIDLSCFERAGSKAIVSLGTIPYAAPELIRRDYLSEATDIYSTGVVFFEMLAGSEEFEKITGKWEHDLKRGKRPDISIIKNEYPEAVEIIKRTLEPDPGMRYSSAHALYHDLFSYYQSISGASQSPKTLSLLCQQGFYISVTQGKTVIGRNDIDPLNPYISESHFLIEFNGISASIYDVGSKNGTRVNGKNIGKNRINLNDTDIIQIANVPLRVRLT